MIKRWGITIGDITELLIYEFYEQSYLGN